MSNSTSAILIADGSDSIALYAFNRSQNPIVPAKLNTLSSDLLIEAIQLSAREVNRKVDAMIIRG